MSSFPSTMRGALIVGGAAAFVVFLVIVGVTSSGTPPTHVAATPAPSFTPTNPAGPTPTPIVASATGGLRQAHTPGTLLDDLTLAAGQCHAITEDAATGAYLPDAACTPGAVDPAVTEATIGATICVSGYTANVRPSTSLTGPAKSASLADYGMTAGPTVEYDHLVPLELGGASSVSNLWPEPNKATAKSVNNPKDAVENALKKAVCAHTVQLAAAQAAIASNWTTAESVLRLG
jgi:hypothetical protein